MDQSRDSNAHAVTTPTTGVARQAENPSHGNTRTDRAMPAATSSIRPRPRETKNNASCDDGAVDPHAAPSAAKRRRKNVAAAASSASAAGAPVTGVAASLGVSTEAHASAMIAGGAVAGRGNAPSHRAGGAGAPAASHSSGSSAARAGLDTLPDDLLHNHVLPFVSETHHTSAMRTLAGVNKALYASTLRFPYTHFNVIARPGRAAPINALASLNTSALTSLRCVGGPAELAALVKAAPFPQLTTLDLRQPRVTPSTVAEANTVVDSLLAVVRASPKLKALQCASALSASYKASAECWRPTARVWEVFGRGSEQLTAFLGAQGWYPTADGKVRVDVMACRHVPDPAPLRSSPQHTAHGGGTTAEAATCLASAGADCGEPAVLHVHPKPWWVCKPCEAALHVPVCHTHPASDYATPAEVLPNARCDCQAYGQGLADVTLCRECSTPCSACGSPKHEDCMRACDGGRCKFVACSNCVHSVMAKRLVIGPSGLRASMHTEWLCSVCDPGY